MRPLGLAGRAAVAALGAVAVGVAVAEGPRWALLAAAGGAAIALSVARWALGAAPRPWPVDFAHTLQLLVRAHSGRAGWAVGLRQGDVTAGPPADAQAPGQPTVERGRALVRLASVDGRTHVAREDVGTFVAVGDYPYGAGILLARRDAPPEVAEMVSGELRRLVAAMRMAESEAPADPGEAVARRLAVHASGAQTLDGVARAGADLAQQISQRAAAVAVRDLSGKGVRVVGVSSAGDRRLANAALAPGGAVWRAIESALPVVAQGDEDVFGPGLPERRRRERAGTAYPLMDGHVAVGALALLGPPLAAAGPVAEQIGRLAMELGPRLAAARSVYEAERRAVSDPLTGLANRREFDRALGRFSETLRPGGRAALIYADLDHFKRLNDTLGHAAGDAALRHVKGILEAHIRDGDLVARIGGEEFAVWLPQTSIAEAAEVAERIRRSVEQTAWHWNGQRYPITISCGVAAYPESTAEVHNLQSLADAGLYRAKEGGRNRVEVAAAAAA